MREEHNFEEPQRISGKRSRQGALGRPVLIVLLVSLFLCAVYLVGMMVWGWFVLPKQGSLLAPVHHAAYMLASLGVSPSAG